jgi:protein SCO1/2
MKTSAPGENCVPLFERDTPAEQIARWVDSVRVEAGCGEMLVALLSERLAFYQGKGSNEVSHIRGYIMATLEKTGLPERGVPLVLEELESGHLAYEVGAAAVALRGLTCPSRQMAPYLFQAIENIRYRDDFVCYDTFLSRPSATRSKTALQEIFGTFAWMGAHAVHALPDLNRLYTDPCIVFSGRVRAELKTAIETIQAARAAEAASSSASNCCLLPVLSSRWINFPWPEGSKPNGTLDQLPLEDQDGNRLAFAEFFLSKPAVVVFFYTRCDNPRKCSLTISKVALLQKAIHSRGLAGCLKIAGFTYDPLYDSASRLKTYGRDRGMRFDEDNRLFRTRTGLERLQEHFDLGVGFLNSIVNRHRIELYILDANGRTAASFTRFQWDIDDVLDRASELLSIRQIQRNNSGSPRATTPPWPILQAGGRALLSAIPGSLLAIAPKCPVCWAAWLGALGIAGWNPVGRLQWLLPLCLGIVVVQALVACVRTRTSGRGAALFLLLSGILMLLIGKANGATASILLLGVAALAAGFFVSFLPRRTMQRPTEELRPKPGGAKAALP